MLNELILILRYMDWRRIGELLGGAALGVCLAALLWISLWLLADAGFHM